MIKFIDRLTFKPEITHKIYGLISRIDELKGQWKMGSNLSPQSLNLLKRSVIVTSSGASTRIEGARLSDDEVKKLLKGLTVKKLITRDEQEVIGYAELLSNVFDSYQKIKLSENTIKHFHSELLKYSEKDIRHRGKYKFGDNRVEAKDASGNLVGILFDPTPPHLVEKEIDELLSATLSFLDKKEIHPLIIIGNFIFEFLSIHPFQDGNGRTSRVLTNLLLLKSGYGYVPYISHEKLIEDNKDDYYIALHKSQKAWKTKKEDISTWLLFLLNILLKQSQLANGLMDQEAINDSLSEKQLAVWNYFNEHDIITPKNLKEDLKMPIPTITQIINKFLEMNKIERMGEGRATRYKIKE